MNGKIIHGDRHLIGRLRGVQGKEQHECEIIVFHQQSLVGQSFSVQSLGRVRAVMCLPIFLPSATLPTMDSETVKIFTAEFKKRAQDLQLNYSPEEIQKIAEERLPTLFKIEPFYFSEDTKDFIAASAAKNLAQNLISGADKNAAWSALEENFRENNYWGFPTQSEKPKAPRTNTVKELAIYVWTMIQAFLIMKTVIFYFGIKSASDDESMFGMNTLLLLLAISVSFSSLLFFAWRKNRQK